MGDRALGGPRAARTRPGEQAPGGRGRAMIKGSERDDGMPQGNGEVAKAGAEKDDLFVNIMGGARKVAVLTGAGASKESGIPTFREDNGVWSKWDPLEVATPEGFRKDPARVWAFHEAFLEAMTSARPHPGHLVLAEMEPRYDVFAIITQNIDNLHQEGGSKNVIEFHGNGRRLVCLKCNAAQDAEKARANWDKEFPPRCPECGYILKPDVVFFGEPIPPQASARAMELAQGVSVLLVVGTSATVAPASYIPMVARKTGAAIVEINIENTVLSEGFADYTLLGKAGETLPILIEAVEAVLDKKGGLT